MTIRDMVARKSKFGETGDFIPTPPWVTRCVYEMFLPQLKGEARDMVAWDPSAGHGHMSRTMAEYGHPLVRATDIAPNEELGVGQSDFLGQHSLEAGLILTNPPYALLTEFILQGLAHANRHLVLLVRIQALESQSRYNRVFSVVPPTKIGFFSDRIPFRVGRVVKKAPKMFFHCLLHWDMEQVRRGKEALRHPPMWIRPDAQRILEKDVDYEG